MALGYEGFVEIDSTSLLCTSFSASINRTKMESAAGYGGELSTPESSIGIGSPHTYDWESIEGSIDFEFYKDVAGGPSPIVSLYKSLLGSRQTSFQVASYTRKGGRQIFEECYWNSLSINYAEGSLVSGSVSFLAIDRETYTIGGDYIDNKYGIPWAKWSLDTLIQSIPFWKITIKDQNYLTWSLSLSQSVEKFFGCTNTTGSYTEAQEPLLVGIGPMTGQFQFEIFPDDTINPVSAISDEINSLTIVIEGEDLIRLTDLELVESSDPIESEEALSKLSLTYDIYGIRVP